MTGARVLGAIGDGALEMLKGFAERAGAYPLAAGGRRLRRGIRGKNGRHVRTPVVANGTDLDDGWCLHYRRKRPRGRGLAAPRNHREKYHTPRREPDVEWSYTTSDFAPRLGASGRGLSRRPLGECRLTVRTLIVPRARFRLARWANHEPLVHGYASGPE